MKTAAKRERKTLRMVELALLLGAAVFLLSGIWALNTQRDLADRVVRLHVLANSDTEEDQALKLLVRDAVLERATEILEQSEDRKSAEALLRESLPELEALAGETVRANGYDYAVTAELEDTSFPTKEYDGFALPAGEYLALRILIGEGAGQNWWCVVFPVHRRLRRCAGDGPGRRPDGGSGEPDDRRGQRLRTEVQGRGVVGAAAGVAGGLNFPVRRKEEKRRQTPWGSAALCV